MKKYIFTFAILALGLAACNKENLVETPEVPETAAAPVYQISIPASMGTDTKAVTPGEGGKLVTSFSMADDIYVGKYFGPGYGLIPACSEYVSIYLHADANAKTANLTCDALSFGYWDSITYDGENYEDVFMAEELENDDQLLLIYNSKYESIGYWDQTGTIEGLNSFDYALAIVDVSNVSGDAISGYTATTSSASFENLQSMYRFTFTGLPVGVGVSSVVISSAGNKLFERYFPASGYGDSGNITITLDAAARTANGEGVVYAALRFTELGGSETDKISFTVTGTDGNIYLAEKNSPVGGFSNSKYYTSTIPLSLQD